MSNWPRDQSLSSVYFFWGGRGGGGARQMKCDDRLVRWDILDSHGFARYCPELPLGQRSAANGVDHVRRLRRGQVRGEPVAVLQVLRGGLLHGVHATRNLPRVHRGQSDHHDRAHGVRKLPRRDGAVGVGAERLPELRQGTTSCLAAVPTARAAAAKSWCRIHCACALHPRASRVDSGAGSAPAGRAHVFFCFASLFACIPPPPSAPLPRARCQGHVQQRRRRELVQRVRRRYARAAHEPHGLPRLRRGSVPSVVGPVGLRRVPRRLLHGHRRKRLVRGLPW
jgi:hypothetical protein